MKLVPVKIVLRAAAAAVVIVAVVVVVVAAVVVAVAVIVVVAVADAVNTEHSFKTQQRADICSGPFSSSGSTSHYSHHIFSGKRF